MGKSTRNSIRRQPADSDFVSARNHRAFVRFYEGQNSAAALFFSISVGCVPIPIHAIAAPFMPSGGTLEIVIRDVEIAHQLPLKARPQIMVPMNGDNGRIASYVVAVLGMAA